MAKIQVHNNINKSKIELLDKILASINKELDFISKSGSIGTTSPRQLTNGGKFIAYCKIKEKIKSLKSKIPVADGKQ